MNVELGRFDEILEEIRRRVPDGWAHLTDDEFRQRLGAAAWMDAPNPFQDRLRELLYSPLKLSYFKVVGYPVTNILWGATIAEMSVAQVGLLWWLAGTHGPQHWLAILSVASVAQAVLLLCGPAVLRLLFGLVRTSPRR
jgi:hypothetical protein